MSSPTARTVVNEGPGDGNDYGAAITLIKATEESVNTAYVDLTQRMDDGPQKILDMAVDMGIPKDTRDLKPNSGISLGARPRSARSTWPTPTARSPTAAAPRTGTCSPRSPTPTARTAHRGAEEDRRGLLESDINSDVCYALQQVVKNGTGANAQALGRPAAGKTGTATNDDSDVSSSWFVGYTPQLATAVMYVRGDGNDDAQLRPPERRRLRAGLPRALLRRGVPDQDLDRR